MTASVKCGLNLWALLSDTTSLDGMLVALAVDWGKARGREALCCCYLGWLVEVFNATERRSR